MTRILFKNINTIKLLVINLKHGIEDMKVSTRTRYGLRLMIVLASQRSDRTVQLGEIALKENISEKYLSQIVIPLKAANLITSIRGAGGGYKLNRDSSNITVKEIVEVLEGNLYPVACGSNPSACDKFSTCITQKVWKKMGDEIGNTLQKLTLKNLLEDSKRDNAPFVYTI